MGPYTQPMTEREIAYNRAYRQASGMPLPDGCFNLAYPPVSFANEPVIEPVAIDWLEINREFS